MKKNENFETNKPVVANPEANCPAELLAHQKSLQVIYIGFDDQEHSGIIEIHQDIMDDVLAFFEVAYRLRFPVDKVLPASDPKFAWDDNKLMAANASSAFNYRLIAGTDKISLHGLGRAFDINPRQNPYIRYKGGETTVLPDGAAWDPNHPGTLHAEHELVRFMENLGWEWGGHWAPESGRTDYQHFQKPVITD